MLAHSIDDSIRSNILPLIYLRCPATCANRKKLEESLGLIEDIQEIKTEPTEIDQSNDLVNVDNYDQTPEEADPSQFSMPNQSIIVDHIDNDGHVVEVMGSLEFDVFEYFSSPSPSSDNDCLTVDTDINCYLDGNFLEATSF